MIVKMIVKILGFFGLLLLCLSVVLFSMLHEQSKRVEMLEAANEGLIKELSSVNNRIVLFTRARNEGRQFKIEVDEENEKNIDWAGDAVPVDVINRLCQKVDCAAKQF